MQNTEKTPKTKNIVYSRGFPFGAPLVMLRGAGTKDIKAELKSLGFSYNGSRYAWESYKDEAEFAELLRGLAARGYNVIPKKDMDPGYVINLSEEASC